MTDDPLRWYRQIWLVDFEFSQPPGETPDVICLVAREFRTGETLRVWADEFGDTPPIDTSHRSLFVAYFASAELACFLELGWKPPERILDLFVEFRLETNNLPIPSGNGLLGALIYHGLPSMLADEKSTMRDLAIRGGPFTEDERTDLLDYCESDVVALAKLLPQMLPRIDLPRALLRGRYMSAVSVMERNGIPVDVETLERFQANWERIKSRLIREIDKDFGVYVSTGRPSLNWDSPKGRAIGRAAKDYGVDAAALNASATDVAKEWNVARRGKIDAIKYARRLTGLTAARISKLENSGRHYSSWLHLGESAQSLSEEFPTLEIDGEDPAARLWNLLREPTPSLHLATDDDVLSEAARRCEEYDPLLGDAPLSFSSQKFAEYLTRNEIPWPRTESGSLSLNDDTFRQMARRFNCVSPLRELRHALGEMRLFKDLQVGKDGRNRCILSPFRSRTSRNQPSNSRFIFGASCWLRGLIKPAEGRAIAYIDWSQQEFGIAAVLSGDIRMSEAYASGDPYLTFAKQAGAVPADATKQSHPAERAQFKVCALAVQYGMAEHSLALSLGAPVVRARQLLTAHKQTYPQYWAWSTAAIDRAMLGGSIWTRFGWRVHAGSDANIRSLANFPCQANGAEMLRLACCLATERGIQVCAPVHDAVLIESAVEDIDETVQRTQAAMAEASRVLLDGFELRTDADVVKWPHRYEDERGTEMWARVDGIIKREGVHPQSKSDR